jgi:sugar lactone lactonase YvrE
MNHFKSITQSSGKLVCGLAVLAALSSRGQVTINTEAGYTGQGSADGVGATAQFRNPQGVVADAAGNVYVADTGNNVIRVITPGGVSSTLAGVAGVAGSADGTGSGATFNQPTGITLDSATNLYVTDSGNNTIRKVTLSGQVTTIAGSTGVAGSANNTGTNALFSNPLGIAIDAGNNLYVADYGNDLIRKITPGLVVSTLAGQAGVAGAGNGSGTGAQFNQPEGLTVDGSGNVYVADTGNATIRMVTSGGAVTTLAGSPGSLGSTDGTGTNAVFYQPVGIAISGSTLWVSDAFANTIRQVTTGGAVLTVAGQAKLAGSQDGAGTMALFSSPHSLAVSSSGIVLIADTLNGTVRQMNGSYAVTTLAGSPTAAALNGMTTAARFYSPQGIAADSANNVYVADTRNSVIRKITPAGVVSILAGNPGTFGYAEGTGSNALFSAPQAVAVDGSGNVYVADTGNSIIRKLTSGGSSSTLAGSAGSPGNADGMGTAAQFSQPKGVAVDGNGNVYVADSANHTIRKITSSGSTSTLAGMAGTYGSFDGAGSAARFNFPTGIAVDGSGNIYVTDFNNDTVREVSPAGVVSTLAGVAGLWGSADGTGSAAQFYLPTAIAVDGSGNLYVVDSGNNTLRKLTPSGTNWVVSTVAGTAGVVGAANGTGTAAQFNFPSGVAVNPAGYLFVADAFNNIVRTSKGVATLTWATPAPIVYGTALSGTQLNAGNTVFGTLAYTPAAGTVLNTGVNTLTVTLTPADSADYTGATTNVSLVVTPASLLVAANNTNRPYGATNPAFTGSITGLQNNDSISATYASSATPSSPPGTYAIVPTLVDPNNRATNYVVTLQNGTLTVGAAAGVFQSVVRQPNGTILFNLSGTVNATYTLDVSSDLQTWTPLTTFSMTNGAVQIVDTTATNYSSRYYILAAP